MKQSINVGGQLLWSSRYGCNNGRYGCTIVMSYIEINKAVSQWLLTFNLYVSVTWPLTCAFHIPCTHTPEIIDMHRGMCDKVNASACIRLQAKSIVRCQINIHLLIGLTKHGCSQATAIPPFPLLFVKRFNRRHLTLYQPAEDGVVETVCTRSLFNIYPS